MPCSTATGKGTTQTAHAPALPRDGRVGIKTFLLTAPLFPSNRRGRSRKTAEITLRCAKSPQTDNKTWWELYKRPAVKNDQTSFWQYLPFLNRRSTFSTVTFNNFNNCSITDVFGGKRVGFLRSTTPVHCLSDRDGN